jgi:hypothetical protein
MAWALALGKRASCPDREVIRLRLFGRSMFSGPPDCRLRHFRPDSLDGHRFMLCGGCSRGSGPPAEAGPVQSDIDPGIHGLTIFTFVSTASSLPRTFCPCGSIWALQSFCKHDKYRFVQWRGHHTCRIIFISALNLESMERGTEVPRLPRRSKVSSGGVGCLSHLGCADNGRLCPNRDAPNSCTGPLSLLPAFENPKMGRIFQVLNYFYYQPSFAKTAANCWKHLQRIPLSTLTNATAHGAKWVPEI